MINSKKKGFTIVELVIVIAVVAILAAVLIPTFSNLVKKANESADIQAVKQMNTVLLAADITDGDLTPEEAVKALEEAGINGDDYIPLYNGRFFFYDADLKQIVYTEYKNDQYTVIFPEDVKSLGLNVQSLTGNIAEKEYSKPTLTTLANGKKRAEFAVSIGEEIAKLAKDFKDLMAGKQPEGLEGFDIKLVGTSNAIKGVENMEVVITLSSDIDFKGASFNLNLNNCVFTLNGGGHTISNIVNSTGFAISSYNSENKASQYGGAFLGYVAGSTIKFESVTFKNCYFGNPDVKASAIFVGQLNGETTVTFKNTTVEDCKVSGLKGVAVYVGHACNDLSKNQNVVFEGENKVSNCDLSAYGKDEDAGLIGTIVGRATYNDRGTKTITGPAPTITTITMKDDNKDIAEPVDRAIIEVTDNETGAKVVKAYTGADVSLSQ